MIKPVMHIDPGRSHPLGATFMGDGVNFCLYSKHATAVELLLFAHETDLHPSRLVLNPDVHRTGHYWHCFVPGLMTGQLYGFRVDGPYEPEQGLRFDRSKVLIDPYATAVLPSNYQRQLACQFGVDNIAACMKCVVTGDRHDFDWQGTRPLNRPFSETVIYELHVKGFTAHPSSGVSADKRGTYAGIIEKIPYLKALGITAVELLPVQQFDMHDVPNNQLRNYWGYSPIAFFAPHHAYAADQTPLGAVHEFKTMVRELHKAGIEVYIDVVFNHTAEGNEQGPTLSFRGLQNDAYYMLTADKQYYANYSGCGNTVNAHNSISRRMIHQCLEYWREKMHIDGFRFDLASVLSRDGNGQPLQDPPILWTIDTDPLLAGCKVIAEAWDAGGLYQVGTFIGDRWQEWNGKFRDDVRQFIKGDNKVVSAFASRLLGSPDLYYDHHTTPHRSINFITAHDGFTLQDLVSFNHKHNEANGEHNRDGDNANHSWNCGAEGPTTDLAVNALRRRQLRNFFTVLMSALGTPMITMGDEVARTQHGNNNAYCQDNEAFWFDWNKVDENGDLLRFVQCLIRWRQRDTTHDRTRHKTLAQVLNKANVQWHGVYCEQPDWGENSHTIALTISEPERGTLLYLAFNAYHETLDFELPLPAPGQPWRRIIDTALPSPDDIVADHQHAIRLQQRRYPLAAYSALLLSSSP